MDKAAVFIDEGYFKRVLSQFGLQGEGKNPEGDYFFFNKVDYRKFCDKLCKLESAERFRTYIYDAEPYQNNPPTKEDSQKLRYRQKFHNWLNGLSSFVVRKGICLKRDFPGCQGYKTGHFDRPCWHITQKGVDVRFAIDLVDFAADKRLDKAILITGDSDFIPAIEYAKEKNTKIILYFLKSEKTGINPGLYFAVDDRHQLEKKMFDDCLSQKKAEPKK